MGREQPAAEEPRDQAVVGIAEHVERNRGEGPRQIVAVVGDGVESSRTRPSRHACGIVMVIPMPRSQRRRVPPACPQVVSRGKWALPCLRLRRPFVARGPELSPNSPQNLTQLLVVYCTAAGAEPLFPSKCS